MRITENMMSNLVLSNLHRSRERMAKEQEKLASQKNFSRPSDNPGNIVKALEHRQSLSELEQFVRNADDANWWLSQTDVVLGEANNILMRAKEKALSQATSTATKESRLAAAAEIEALSSQLFRLANSQLGDRYLFGGQETETQPFQNIEGRIEYRGDCSKIEREIERDTITINIPGNIAFTSIFETMETLKSALFENDEAAIRETIDDFDASMEAILNARGEVGAKVKRLEMTNERLKRTITEVTKYLSEIEDVDLADTATLFASSQNAYQTTLAAAARLIQPKLLDYLR